MKKKVFGRKFKRDVNQRKALFRSLIRALVLHEKIKTTEAKAKAVKGDIEKLITKAKTKKEDSSRELLSVLLEESLVRKVIDEIAPRFESRNGGYTRIIKLGTKKKDNSKVVLLELVELENIKVEEKAESVSEKKAVKPKKEKVKAKKEAKK
ncbi:MAG: 50S ribosomal protein L17 [Candidatus Levybacteria bacterium CG10_big_fil_rev_8_21_14_0_10_36_7]|nr:MAG: 50S ribosomal protein L17 [Candidatus Levybacteria bacterium CG10_big_fil_rev_8_21_14_0_10_36_7]